MWNLPVETEFGGLRELVFVVDIGFFAGVATDALKTLVVQHRGCVFGTQEPATAWQLLLCKRWLLVSHDYSGAPRII